MQSEHADMRFEWVPLQVLRDADKSRRFVFNDAIWLAGNHDEQFTVDFSDYRQHRAARMACAEVFRERAAQLQRQFTFGLLEAVTKRPVDESKLLKVVDGKTYLTDENIFGLMVDWHRDIRSVRAERDNHSWAERTASALDEMCTQLRKETFHGIYSRDFCEALDLSLDDLYHIVAACAAIGEIIHTTAFGSFRMGSIFERIGWSWTFVQVHSEDQTSRMVSKGWCPMMTKILSNIGVSAYNYASTREPFARVEGQNGMSSHGECTSQDCRIKGIDETTYKTKHTQPRCTCQFRSPHIDHIRALLDANKIPIVVYDPNNPDTVTVLPSDGLPYVAVSHVWVDGLGSNSEKGLPICQLKKLAESTKHLLGHPTMSAFWIDSLCVPEEKGLRKKAIGLMAKTYREAYMTLVIDSGIRAGSQNSPKQELALRIVTSSWMHRLWTLQEAWLARKLVFELQDGFVKAGLIKPNEDCFDVTLHALDRVVTTLTKPCKTTDLRSVLRTLTWRSTSKSGDETLAIAGLFDIDAATLVAEPQREKRMMKFLVAMKDLPYDIIFLGGPKLTDVGFRWAPLTMMSGETTGLSEKCGAVCTSEGLLAKYTVVYTSEDIAIDADTDYLLTDEKRGLAFFVVDFENGGLVRIVSGILMETIPENPSNEGNGPLSCVGVKTLRLEEGNRLVCEYVERFYVTVIPLHATDRFMSRLRKTPIIARAETATLDMKLT